MQFLPLYVYIIENGGKKRRRRRRKKNIAVRRENRYFRARRCGARRYGRATTTARGRRTHRTVVTHDPSATLHVRYTYKPHGAHKMHWRRARWRPFPTPADLTSVRESCRTARSVSLLSSRWPFVYWAAQALHATVTVNLCEKNQKSKDRPCPPSSRRHVCRSGRVFSCTRVKKTTTKSSSTHDIRSSRSSLVD